MAALNFISELPLLPRALSIIGLITLSKPFYRFFKVLLDCYVLPGIPLTTYGANKAEPERASWALVTGATDGIGKEFALQLAKKGFNIVIASRTQTKLDTVKAEIAAATNNAVSVKTFAIDFSKATDEDYANLEELLVPLDLGVLVNNVGLSHSIPVLFTESDVQEMEAIAQINVLATLRVSRIAVPLLIQTASTKGRKSLILNLGSFAGSVPTPLLATYAGTKAFLIGWNRALNEELGREGVQSILLNTFLISTAMSKIRKASWSVPTPKQYVGQVLAKIGRSGSAYQEDRRGREMTIWPQHALVEWGVREFMGLGRATAYSYGSHVDIRKRALRKEERIKASQASSSSSAQGSDKKSS